MPCRICGADISGKCFNCGKVAPRGKHYCENCVKWARIYWGDRITESEYAKLNPNVQQEVKFHLKDLRMKMDDEVPEVKKLCGKCSDRKLSF